MGVHYHRVDDLTDQLLASNPLRIELYGRRYIRTGRSWRVFVGDNQTHNHRSVPSIDAAYLEQRFPVRQGEAAA